MTDEPDDTIAFILDNGGLVDDVRISPDCVDGTF